MDSDNMQGPSTAPASASTAPQIRSRITVVCAECKRLKLKCDRRNPCGSCMKRDTVSRCIYSPAAAEKVDLHSLNNRLIQVESTLAQLTSGQFTPSYPFSSPSTSSGGPPPPSSSPSTILNPPTIQHYSLAIPFEEIGGTWLNELDLEVALPAKFSSSSSPANGSGYPSSSGANVKLEPCPVDLPPSGPNDFQDIDMIDRPTTSSSSDSSPYPPPSLSTSSAISSPTSPLVYGTAIHTSLPPVSAYYASSSLPSSSSAPSSKAAITPALFELLPSLNSSASPHSRQPTQPQLSLLTLLTLAEESTTHTHPFLNWKILRERTLELVVNAPSNIYPLMTAKEKEKRDREKEREKRDKERAKARDIFFGNAGNSRSRPVFGANDTNTNAPSQAQQSSRSYYRPELLEDQSGRPPTTSRRTGSGVSFFAALCAAIALGVLEAGKRKEVHMNGNDKMQVDQLYARSESSQSKPNSMDTQNDPGYWYALSVQAIGVWESATVSSSVVVNDSSTSPIEMDREKEKTGKDWKEGLQHDMDYMTACLLQIAFLAKDGLSVCSFADEVDTGEERGYTGVDSLGTRRSAKGVAAVVFPLVGKVVNYARQMELNRDPDDHGPAVSSLSVLQSSEGPSCAPTSASTIPPPPGSTLKKFKSNKLPDASVLSSPTTYSPSAARPKEPVYTLFEAEMRRRMWWTVVYYDLFVSDLLNQPPLIADNSFNTKFPIANVDDKAFGPQSVRIPLPPSSGEDGSGLSKDGYHYFEIRARLTQLVRNVKRRMNTPEFGHSQQIRYSYYGQSSPSHHSYSIDQAASMESEIRACLGDLPPWYQLDNDGECSSQSELDPVLIAQRCEVAITAHRLILKVYLPFLKKHAAAVPHQASLGSINAAHGIIRASRVLSDLWKSKGSTEFVPSSLSPAMFDFYPFPRAVFDAAVVCAHGVIKQPTTMWAAAAMEDVDTALEILRITCRSQFGSALGSNFAVGAGDSVRIVDALKSKAEGGSSRRSVHTASSPSVPSKRKHDEADELEDERAPPAPAPAYVYPTITRDNVPHSETESTPTAHHPPPPSIQIMQTPTKRQPPFPVANSDQSSARPKAESATPQNGDKDKKHAKKGRPSVGIRIRPSVKDPSPLAKPRANATSVTTPSSPNLNRDDRRSSLSTTVPILSAEPSSEVSSEQNGYSQQVQRPPPPQTATPQPSPFPQSVAVQPQMTHSVQDQVGYRSRSSSISQDPRLHSRRQGSLSTPAMDCSMGTYVTSESEVHTVQHGVPEAHLQPSLTSMHPHQAYQHPSRHQQQTYGVVSSPVAYEASQDAASSVRYEYPYGHGPSQQHQEAGVYESYGSSQPPRKNSIDVRSEGYASSSSPYHSSNGPMSAASSPYTNTTAGTPNYGPQTSHQASPQSFALPSSTGVNTSPPQHEYYADPAMYEQSFATAPSSVGLGHSHVDTSMVDGIVADGVEDSLIYEQVPYDVKPPLEALNQQQQQLQHRPHHQQVYQAYDTSPSELNHQHRQSHPLSHSTPVQSVWAATPQQAQLVEDNGQYWNEGGAVTEGTVYYVQN